MLPFFVSPPAPLTTPAILTAPPVVSIIPLLVNITERALVIVTAPAESNFPPLKTNGLFTAPSAAVALTLTVPSFIVTPVVKVFDPVRVNWELLFITPVTLVPIIPLTRTVPKPAPLFVTVPVLLIEGLAVEIVIPEVKELSLSKVKFPVPVIPPDTVNIFVPSTF